MKNGHQLLTCDMKLQTTNVKKKISVAQIEFGTALTLDNCFSWDAAPWKIYFNLETLLWFLFDQLLIPCASKTLSRQTFVFWRGRCHRASYTICIVASNLYIQCVRNNGCKGKQELTCNKKSLKIPLADERSRQWKDKWHNRRRLIH